MKVLFFKDKEEAEKFWEWHSKRKKRIIKLVVSLVLWMVWWVVADSVISYALRRAYDLNPWPLSLTDFLALYWKIGPILLVYDSFMLLALVFGVVVISKRWGE